MSAPFHYLTYRTFAHATEDPAAVVEALRNVVGDVDPETSRAEGYHGNPITIYSGETERASDVDRVLTRLVEAGLHDRLIAELDDRLDDDNLFHIRLDKDAASRGDLAWASDGPVIDLAVKVEAYPAKREKALAALEGYLDARSKGT